MLNDYIDELTRKFIDDNLESQKSNLPPNSTIINGRMKMSGRLVALVIRDKDESIRVSIQIPGGYKGYNFEILKKYLNPESFQDYTDHAYDEVMKSNGFSQNRF